MAFDHVLVALESHKSKRKHKIIVEKSMKENALICNLLSYFQCFVAVLQL
jgi:hypothetical protein